MRKPLVVVLGVTAAVLIGGGIAATTAGADITPGGSAVPALDLPGMPELPQLPGQDGAAGPAGPDQAGLGQAGSNPGGADSAGADPAGTDPGLDQPGQRPAGDQQAAAGDQPDPDGGRPGRDQSGDQAPGRPASDQPIPDVNSQRPGGAGGPGGPGIPGAGPPGGASDAGGPAGSGARGGAARPAAVGQGGADKASVIAAAQRDVSPASVSTSPSAPVQQQVLALVNQNRRRGGCGDLTLDRRLIAAAYDHAYDMARRGYFAHESPNGDGSGDRMREAGYRWSRYGENIARGQESAYEVVDGWMHSPVHRENIMDCRLRQMGIGLAFAPDRTPYWVQDFATPQ